jgi:ATP-binding cassette, subfamily B, bacterial
MGDWLPIARGATNKVRESPAELTEALWPSSRAAEALYAAARHAGMPIPALEAPVLPPDAADRIGPWMDAAAERAQIQVDQVFVSMEEIADLLTYSAPCLIRLTAIDGAPFLAIVGHARRRVLAIGPDLRLHRLRAAAVESMVRAPFETPIHAEIDGFLEQLALPPAARARAREAMLADRLKNARFRGCWLVQLPPGAAIGLEAQRVRLPRRLAVLVASYVAQYVLFVSSWWLLGRAVLTGTVDRGWLWGWTLLLLSLIPIRLWGTWNQGLAAVSVGAWLRRRLLRGAFRIDRQELRHKGAGQLFGLVTESAAVDALALTGGIVAVFALFELIVAAAVLWLGVSVVPAVLLGGWLVLFGFVCARYYHRRRAWTDQRFEMTHHLLENMVGHRTRLAQQPPSERHRREDEELDHYLDRGYAMDGTALWLTALMPRGWLVLGLVGLIPALGANASSTKIAISIGGLLLAYRALQRLTVGLSNLTGAVVAGQSVTALARAARQRETVGLTPNIAHNAAPSKIGSVIVQARDLWFRYRSQGEPVLQGCTANIESGERVLLEGSSGSGKTTLASIVAGLQEPESGVLLVGGLDRAALGATGWRQRVVMAPQAHDNFVVGGSLAMNLLMGRQWPPERADLLEAEAVCRELGLGDLLDRLPAGLNQIVGETGWQLSQGEKTRVFLARGLLQHPRLLVLDESFSALDPDNIERAMRCVTNRAETVLAIAHP